MSAEKEIELAVELFISGFRFRSSGTPYSRMSTDKNSDLISCLAVGLCNGDVIGYFG